MSHDEIAPGRYATSAPTARESMFGAASALERVLDGDPADPAWRVQLRGALGQCVIAVEQHLLALVAPDGTESEIASRTPRLIPALEHLAAALSQLMIHLWETRDDAGHPSSVVMRRLRRLVDEIRDVATEEFMLVIESFHPTGVGD